MKSVVAVSFVLSALSGALASQNWCSFAQRDPALSTLLTALTAGGLTGPPYFLGGLCGTGPFTVFAPTNEAFAKIETKALNTLLANKAELDKVLEYHVLAAKLHMLELMSAKIIKTLEGENVKVSDAGGVIKVDNAKVLEADIGASNAIVHVIDTVLMPPSMSPLPLKANIVQVAERNADLSTLVAALTAGKLVATLEGKGPFTVFAPTNEAFAKIPKATLTQLLGNQKLLDQLLKYHVLGELSWSNTSFSKRDLITESHWSAKLISTLEKESVAVRSRCNRKDIFNGCGEGVIEIMVNNANVVTADVEATNGVVHVVDKVLVPPNFPLSPYPEDIVELAESQPDLSTLVAALVAGKLTATLSGLGPFTVFAPTNEAFAKIPAADLQKLLTNTEELDAVLEYHVLAGKFDMRDLMAVRSAKTLEGDTVTVTGSSNAVNVNDAKVLKADLAATNGIVHVIDTVLSLPSPYQYQKTIVELAVANPDLSTLVTALKAADLVGTLSGKGPFTVWGPSNKAFAKLPAGVLDNLLKPENKAELVDLLTYHVGLGLQTFHGSFHGKSALVKSAEGKDISVTSHFGCQPAHCLSTCTPGLSDFVCRVFVCNCRTLSVNDGQQFPNIWFGNIVRASNGGLYAIDEVLTVPKVVVV